MQKLFIVGNLTKDPDSRVTKDGISVCSFTVAVNRRHRVEGQPDADFFRVTAWRGLADNCAKYLSKGKKVAVTGSVSVNTYQGQDGKTRASMDVTAEDVEFLSQKDKEEEPKAEPKRGGYVEVTEDDIPF